MAGAQLETSPPLDFATVLHEEVTHLGLDVSDRRIALCLSGGGIRSATFSLGVLQGLARLNLLDRIHYLSTVSGGGYIGSWLSAWIHRKGAATVFHDLAQTHTAAGGPEPPEILHLRAYSNYLDPKLGWFSADTWTLVAIFFRNLLLNWSVLVPLLLAVLAVPRIFIALANLSMSDVGCGSSAALWLGILTAACALLYTLIYQFADTRKSAKSSTAFLAGQSGFLLFCLVPLVCSAIAFTALWAWSVNAGATSGSPITWLQAHDVLPAGKVSDWSTWYAVTAVPAILLGVALLVTAYVGLSNRFRWSSDEDLEWWARAGAWVLIATVSWAVVSAVVIFGPIVLAWAWIDRDALVKSAVAASGALSGLISIIGGRSGSTPGAPNAPATAPSNAGGSRIVAIATMVAAPVFIVVLLTLLSMLTNILLSILGRVLNQRPFGIDFGSPLLPPASWHLEVVSDAPVTLVGIFILLTAAASIVLAFFINVNKFSLHSLYRFRLIRAYLGASNSSRKPDLFTGFDDNDNIQMHALASPAGSDAKTKPLHIVNIALNLVGGHELAWQERKAESFTMSPLHCGTRRLRYRRSNTYGGNKRPRFGVSLGTAMAISGAAASPNMGYHSSPAVTFVMTLFNARLGWWLGNPGNAGHRTYQRWGPEFALGPVVEELLGLTDDTRPYVYLSDGGHFENLGLYEMVARRCATIIVIDAGCDAGYVFEDLGNAIRKIRIDLGIPITLKVDAIHGRSQAAGKYFAIGDVDYAAMDAGAPAGKLLYVKPCVYGDEPVDVGNYAASHPDFPHEPTTDQWFTESQFESYRALGLHIIESVMRNDKVRAPLGL